VPLLAGSPLMYQPKAMESFSKLKHQNTQQPELTAFSCSPVNITRREAQVLLLLANGYLTRDVALQLKISVSTVNTHLKNIYKKTGAQNKIEALNKTRWLTASLPGNQY
jgi:DNA-binding NarL/FixJ family response regulator